MGRYRNTELGKPVILSRLPTHTTRFPARNTAYSARNADDSKLLQNMPTDMAIKFTISKLND